jgi:glycosyltransferase involved in cell wall biosynthesis
MAEGTGIATYGREISKILGNAGHEVFPIYDFNGIPSDSSLMWPVFLQKLAIQNHSAFGRIGNMINEKIRWIPNGFGRFPAFLSGKSLTAQEISLRENVDYSAIIDRFPFFSKIYNIPSLYRSAQAYSYFVSKNIKIKLPAGERPDIFHITSPVPVTMAGVPKVLTVHDVIPLSLPYSTKVNLKHYKRMLNASLKDADLIFSVSQYSKKDLIEHFNVPDEKIFVTYQSVDIPGKYKELPYDHVSQYIRRKYNLSFGSYFLFYGAVEPKKNILRILEALSLAKTRLPIVIVGKKGWLFHDVDTFLKSTKDSERFIRIPYASFRSLMYLLKGARGLVFPSLQEGFGLPVLEAMQMGCPVITSNRTSLPEIGGDAVHYVDPRDIEDIASALDLFSEDDTYTSQLVEKGYHQAQKFSPDQHLKRVMEGYSKVL